MRGGGVAESYDCKKAWPSIKHSILSASIPVRGCVGVVLNGQFLLPGQNLVAPDPVLVVQGEAENRDLSNTEKDSHSSFQYSI